MSNCGSRMHFIDLILHPAAHQLKQQIVARNNHIHWAKVHCSLPKKNFLIRTNHGCLTCRCFPSKNYIADLRS